MPNCGAAWGEVMHELPERYVPGELVAALEDAVRCAANVRKGQADVAGLQDRRAYVLRLPERHVSELDSAPLDVVLVAVSSP
eukprot:COSAG01_NODE_1878_length_8994_cov_122.548960_5_plen_82_part_00